MPGYLTCRNHELFLKALPIHRIFYLFQQRHLLFILFILLESPQHRVYKLGLFISCFILCSHVCSCYVLMCVHFIYVVYKTVLCGKSGNKRNTCVPVFQQISTPSIFAVTVTMPFVHIRDRKRIPYVCSCLEIC